jgi:DNA polymerase-4
VLHIDLDAFYASVEALERPELKGQPILVGGRPEERGVVAAASYEARAYGVHSAMPTHRALRLCPQAVICPPRHDLYRRYSRQVMAVLAEVAGQMEQVSIDEAYLDLTRAVGDWREAVETARQLQVRIVDGVGLSVSVGVATNKLVAKVASDFDKPGGLTVVAPGEEAAFLAPLPVRVLWGVGPVTSERLEALGMVTVGDVAGASALVLQRHLGRRGAEIAAMAQGKDQRRVASHRERKSVSQERTFQHDLLDPRAIRRRLWELSQGVARRLARSEMWAWTVSIKVRYADFTTLSRQMKLTEPTGEAETVFRAAVALMRRAWQRSRPIRLLGVGGHELVPPTGQLSLFDDAGRGSLDLLLEADGTNPLDRLIS